MSEISSSDETLRQVIRALEPLTWSADHQLNHIRDLDVGVDELALEFDDAFRLALGRAAQGELPQQVVTLLTPTNDKLESMTTQGLTVWTPEALTEAPEWVEVRAESARALEALRSLEV
ncbi:hypothetical protein ACFU5O_18155 [Streptomyces sp. NPDC057445]|uniref:hypothetical protein n=1 Tax=Streptomyces sp. NPDC057445 TaxID=3346136 RepID=UPI003688EEC9